jgi:hypothetical protein
MLALVSLEAESTPGPQCGTIMSMKNSNDTIGNRTRDLPACSAVPQPTAVSRHACALNKRTALRAAVFTKLTNAQQHCVQNSHAEFQTNRAVKVESTDSNAFTPSSNGQLSLGRFS